MSLDDVMISLNRKKHRLKWKANMVELGKPKHFQQDSNFQHIRYISIKRKNHAMSVASLVIFCKELQTPQGKEKEPANQAFKP